MNKVNSYLSLIRFYNPIGFWLLLWPGLWGLFLTNSFEIDHFTIVVLGSFLTRSLGCAINDLLDHKYDREVDRTKERPLANGELSFAEGIIILPLLKTHKLWNLKNGNASFVDGFTMKRKAAKKRAFRRAPRGRTFPMTLYALNAALVRQILK